MRPIGYFVHDQGRGHAKRCAAILRALPSDRPVTVFTSSPDMLAELGQSIEIIRLPSLYDNPGDIPAALEALPQPETMHFVPLGWPSIREAMHRITAWFERADPALFVVDVSAELTLLARLCSVPCIMIRQHGNRWDPAHRMAYDSCVGLIAPFDARLEQPDTPQAIVEKTFYSGGLNPSGTAGTTPFEKDDRRLIVVLSGGGGDGFPLAPLAAGARALPDTQWLVLGQVQNDTAAALPENLRCLGWVAEPDAYLHAADLVIASAGDSTVHEILQRGKPYLCLPEWRYFDEHIEKAQALARLKAAHVLSDWPQSADAWIDAVTHASRINPDLQRSLVDPGAAHRIAAHLEQTIARLWDRREQQA